MGSHGPLGSYTNMGDATQLATTLLCFTAWIGTLFASQDTLPPDE